MVGVAVTEPSGDFGDGQRGRDQQLGRLAQLEFLDIAFRQHPGMLPEVAAELIG